MYGTPNYSHGKVDPLLLVLHFFPKTPSTSMSEINIMKWFISSACNGTQRLFAHLYKAYINLK